MKVQQYRRIAAWMIIAFIVIIFGLSVFFAIIGNSAMFLALLSFNTLFVVVVYFLLRYSRYINSKEKSSKTEDDSIEDFFDDGKDS